ncbi:MAG: permease-like cell division protein FtsX [Desulfobacterales bacterium]
MPNLFYKRAIDDILRNKFSQGVTIITFALSILIVGAYLLFFINAEDFMKSWGKGIRIMAYLEPNQHQGEQENVKRKIQKIPGVQSVRFIPKEEALNRMKEKLKTQRSLLMDLKENPLPDAFEIRVITALQGIDKLEEMATQIKAISFVDEVEYGRKWISRFSNIFALFRLTGYALGGLFFMATVFIVANTIRLVLYSKREEIEIMRLVGATDRFIKVPFYIEGLIQGAIGGLIGLLLIFVPFKWVTAQVEDSFSSALFPIRFFPPEIFLGIIICSMCVGWLGCYLSLKQFLEA